MDIKKWKKKIMNLQIYDDIKNNLINFFELFHSENSLSFIKIKDPNLNTAFNNINNYKSLSICLDIEFQASLIKKNTNKYTIFQNEKGDDTAKFIREIGILFFAKQVIGSNENIWYYIGHIFVNFDSLENYGFNIMNLR